MPSSWTGNDHYFVADLKRYIQPKTAIDVGVGEGKIGRLIKQVAPQCKITGHEISPVTTIWDPPYSDNFIGDFYAWTQNHVDWQTDLIVFGDVLEHFEYHQALSILQTVHYRAKWIAVFAPLSYLQNSINGNPHEAHRCVIGLYELAAFNIIHYVKDPKENIIYCLIKGLPS